SAPVGIVKANITLAFAAPFDKVPAVPLTDVPYDGTVFTVGGDALAVEIFKRFGTLFGPEATRPPMNLSAASTTLLFFDKDNKPTPGEQRASNPLTISWVKAPK